MKKKKLSKIKAFEKGKRKVHSFGCVFMYTL